jgi:hypothetical protein
MSSFAKHPAGVGLQAYLARSPQARRAAHVPFGVQGRLSEPVIGLRIAAPDGLHQLLRGLNASGFATATPRADSSCPAIPASACSWCLAR